MSDSKTARTYNDSWRHAGQCGYCRRAQRPNTPSLDDIQSGVLRPRPTPYVATPLPFALMIGTLVAI